MNTIDAAALAGALFSVVGSIVGAVLIWFLKEEVGRSRIEKINSNLDRIYSEFIIKQAWVMEAVRYAEQEFWDKSGQYKYDAVMTFISKKVQEHGIDLTVEELKVLVEGELFKLREGLLDEWKEMTESMDSIEYGDPSTMFEEEKSTPTIDPSVNKRL